MRRSRFPMGSVVVSVLLALSADARGEPGQVSFAAKPTVEKVGAAVKVRFAVTAATDVEVAILDAGGRVVRHLAAGMLGANAPAPLTRGSLSQELTWDGKADNGLVHSSDPADGPGALRVRVRLGAAPKFEKSVGFDGNTLGGSLVGLAVGNRRELFVLLADGHGRSALRVLDKDGRYLRTIMPWPAKLPSERTAAIGHLDVAGERLPIVFNGHGHNLNPLTSGLKKQNMVVSPKGCLLLCSAVGTHADHGSPRHLLAVAPDGGAADGMGFVGPQIRRPIGFMGGAGEGGAPFFDHLAVSPDGQWIYLALSGSSPHSKPQHAVFRLRWSDAELPPAWLGKQGEAGDDDGHLNNPQGLAVDPAGRLFVADMGNSRVMVFQPDGKLLGKFPVQSPEQVFVHPAGDIYIVSQKIETVQVGSKTRRQNKSILVKFSPFGKGEAKELARLEQAGVDLVALDPEASPARLWMSLAGSLLPVTDKGDKLEAGPPVNNHEGLSYPSFLAADPAHDRVLVRELFTGLTFNPIRAVDLKTGRKTGLLSGVADVAIDRQGNICALGGYGNPSIHRFTPEGKPLNWPGADSHIVRTEAYASYGPDVGLRGHCVAPNGDIYMIRSNKWTGGITNRIDVYSADGKLKKAAFIDGLGYGDCGMGVDGAGNVYVGSNVKPPDQPLPAAFAGKVPADTWVYWRKGVRQPPWQYAYYNTYLYHYGSVVKFGPAGGAIYGYGTAWPAKSATQPEAMSPLNKLENAPADARTFRSGYLAREVKVVGGLWTFQGAGIIPGSDVNWGDPACCCQSSRLAVDDYGRVFAPDCFRFTVHRLDSSGNVLGRIGRYGNTDEVGPEIAFAWPAFVSAAQGKVYVCDPVNRRVSVIRFDYADQAEAAVP